MSTTSMTLASILVSAVISGAPVLSAQAGQAAKPQGQAASTQPAAADTTFLQTAGSNGQAEVALATVAQEKATNARVKAYAGRLHQDHQQANKELMGIASRKSVKIPEPSAAKKATSDKLAKLTGAAFDKAYISQMVTDHRQGIASFTKASSSTDADVKAFATKTLPTLKAHLAEAEQIQKELGGQ